MPAFRTALEVRLPNEPVAAGNAEHEWFADLFHIEGKKCVIWVHRTTLLGFVRPRVTAAELREFPALFRYEFRTALAFMALPESQLERFDIYSAARYAPRNERGIVGSMLDYRNMFDVMVAADGGLEGADIRGIDAQLNE